METITIGQEQEAPGQWLFEVSVVAHSTRYDYRVTLGWNDYDLWSRGRIPPSQVVYRLFEFLLKREPAQAILSRFDCSLVRRYFPEVDRLLPPGREDHDPPESPETPETPDPPDSADLPEHPAP